KRSGKPRWAAVVGPTQICRMPISTAAARTWELWVTSRARHRPRVRRPAGRSTAIESTGAAAGGVVSTGVEEVSLPPVSGATFRGSAGVHTLPQDTPRPPGEPEGGQ